MTQSCFELTPTVFVPATSIDEVIDRFDEVIEWSATTGEATGIFAALYRRVTVRIRGDLGRRGVFDDPARMERFDCAFANRYFEAVHRYRNRQLPTESWLASFMVADHPDLVILQHILLGVNAHMNLDLGVAAAEVAPGAALRDLRRDFFTINEILGELIDRDRLAVHGLSPAIKWVDRFGPWSNDVIRFSIARARAHSWEVAERLAPLSGDDLQREIDLVDRFVSGVAYVVIHPGPWMAAGLRVLVKRPEEKDYVTAARLLRGT